MERPYYTFKLKGIKRFIRSPYLLEKGEKVWKKFTFHNSIETR